ncbi:YdaU family protein [Cupriavidus basilensis]|uniref:YdaU family protein n=1 Tax=Cupriavidus basilensis TaxID=68895 RepID=UPI0020A6D55C|nr:DUF1376 domain-containing protein [Cupriavidus basilensis]
MSKAKEKADVWMPLYIGDYLADTTRLTTEQHGAYLLLMMDYWRNGPPPNEDATLAQITRLSVAAWKKNKATVLRFFTETDGLLHQKRINQELQACQTRKDTAVAKATLAAEKRWGKKPPASASGDATSMLQALPGEVPEQSPSSSPSPTTTSLSGDVTLSGTAGEGNHATSHLLNQQTGEPNPRPVQIRILLRQHGMTVTSDSAEVLDMARAGVTDLEITETVDVFRAKKPGDTPNARYILSMITTAREKAARAAAAASAAGSAASSPAASAAEWWLGSAAAIEAEGAKHGVKWKKSQNEPFRDFKVRVCKAAGEGPWRDHLMNQLAREKSSQHAEIHQYIYGHPPLEVEA